MDIAEVERFGKRLQNEQVARLRDLAVDVDRMVASVQWFGSDGDRFRSWWPEKQAMLNRIADDLHGFGQSALNNASDQRATSEVSGTSSMNGTGGVARRSLAPQTRQPAPQRWESETRTHTIDAGIGVASTGNVVTSTVELVEMADGTYRVRMHSDFAGTGGVGVTAGVEIGSADITVGLTADGELTNGWTQEFTAPDEATARELFFYLDNRSESLTNRFTAGGVDLSELSHVYDDVPGVEYSSFTERHPSGELDVDVSLKGTPVSVSRDFSTAQNSTSYDAASDSFIDRTVFETDGGGTVTAEIYRDRVSGDSVKAVLTTAELSTRDLQDGGSNLIDTALGPLYDKDHVEVTNTITTREFDLSSPQSQTAFGGLDGRGALFALVDEPDSPGGEFTSVATYRGEFQGSSVNAKFKAFDVGAGYSAGSYSENMELVSYEESP